MLNGEHFKRIWKAMAEIYGRRFLDEFGVRMPRRWEERLAVLSPRQIAYGIEVCENAGDAHPPTLSQFVVRCKAMPSPDRFMQPMLPRPRANPVKARAAHERIQRDLAKGRMGRSVALPGETLGEWQEARRRARMSETVFTAYRFLLNGWTVEEERSWLGALNRIGRDDPRSGEVLEAMIRLAPTMRGVAEAGGEGAHGG